MINLYGILISFSILLCILVSKSLIEKENKNKEDTLWGISLWAIIGGIIGARIYHVLSYLPYYIQNPYQIIKLWNGGLGIWGAIIGGCIGVVIFLRKNKEDILYWLDVASVVLSLGQAIGRWGNFFNNEIFGTPTNLPWGVYIQETNRPLKYIEFNKFHPLFIYESILNLILFITLYLLYKKYKNITPKGVFLFLYIGSYSIIRFILEYLRIDSWKIGSLNVSQCISILGLSLSILFIKKASTKMNKEKI